MAPPKNTTTAKGKKRKTNEEDEESGVSDAEMILKKSGRRKKKKTKEVAEEIEDEEEEEGAKWEGLVKKAVKENSKFVRLVEAKIYESKTAMAAYLGYAKTKSLTKLQDRFFEDWTNRKSRESVIATLKAEIGKGFDNPSANTFSSRINETRFFQYAGVVNSIPDDVLAAGLPVDRKLYSATEKHSVLPTVSYVVAAYQLSRTFPEWMVSYSDTGRLSESTETLANIHPENWHRLFQAIRFFLSLLGSDITQRKDTIDNPEARKVVRKPQNKPAMRLQYLDKEEMIGVSRKKAAASNVQADAALQVTQVQELLRSSLLSEQNTGQKKKTREEIEEGINEFGEALNITGEKVVGNRAGMPPLTSEAQEKLLDIIFQRTVKNKQMYYRRRFEWSSHSRQLSRV